MDDLIKPRLERNEFVGIVIGVMRGDDRRVFAYGKTTREKDERPDGDTLFEIGSITKTFTTLLLADNVERGLVRLDDPIQTYLPETVRAPMYHEKPITLQHLATHTSGLPRIDGNLIFRSIFGSNPYRNYDARQLYWYLNHFELQVAPGSHWEYSNTGVGLLGHILARRADASYETLLIERICKPLGMSDTRITLTPELRKRLATPYDWRGNPTSTWKFDVLAGAGAICSTANDMLAYLAAQVGARETPLAAAINLCQREYATTDFLDNKQGLAWLIDASDVARPILWHNGGTGGFSSYVAFVKPARTGVVVLANSSIFSATGAVEAIGFDILVRITYVAR